MSEWQPIETAPKDEWIMCIGHANLHTIVRLEKHRDDPSLCMFWWDGSGYYRLDTFSHWMELPEPPEEKK